MVKMSVPAVLLVLLLALLPGVVSAAPTAPVASGTEANTTRSAHGQDGLLRREFDLAGSRGYWVDGISLLGYPDFDAQAMGLAQPARRLPTGLSGHYSHEPDYQRYGLNLNGVQGQATQTRYTSPIDTPSTRLVWERYGFAGNAFHLDFRRLLTDSIGLDLGVASHGTNRSDVYRYQDVVHQFYTGSLKRDSSRVPLVGRNLAYGTMHIKPALTWYFPHSALAVEASFLSVDNDDATRHLFQKDTATYSKFTYLHDPYNVRVDASYYGASWSFRPNSKWALTAAHRFSTQDIEFNDLPATVQRIDRIDTLYYPADDTLARDTSYNDTLFYDSAWTERYSGQSGEWSVGREGPFNPRLHLSYEFLDVKSPRGYEGIQSSTLFQDREHGWIDLSDTLGSLGGHVQFGLQRNSPVTDGADFAPSFAGEATLALASRLRAYAAWQRDTRFPDATETHVLRTGRLAYPNPNLKAEERDRREGRLEWDAGGLFYGLGLRSESADNRIVPQWTVQERLVTLTPQQAFVWVNRTHVESHDWFFRTGFRVGNWRVFGERGATLDRSRSWDVPSHYYKGSVVWNNRFVEKRMGVSVRWDAQWFGSRYDYALTRYNQAVPVELSNYLVLDFEARMQVRSFEIYTRIENMNHSQIEPEAGYAPPGIAFRYGISWSLDD